MILHFLEVWLLIVVTFIVGCVLGAILYGALADSRLALAQGALADGVGDLLDAIKTRLGMGPAWRPRQMSHVARQAAAPVPAARVPVPQAFDDDDGEEEAEPSLPPPAPKQALPPPDPRPRMIARVASRTLEPRLGREPPVDGEGPEDDAESVLTGGDPDRLASAARVRNDGVVPMRPAGLHGPRSGLPDNLTRIRGIGQRNEEILNGLGIYHFSQIASWTPGEVRWIGQYLAFPERIERDDWVGQAIMLASGTDTGFVKSADRRRERRRREREQRNMRAAGAPAVDDFEVDPFAEDMQVRTDSIDPGDELAAQLRAARRRPTSEHLTVDDVIVPDAAPDDAAPEEADPYETAFDEADFDESAGDVNDDPAVYDDQDLEDEELDDERPDEPT